PAGISLTNSALSYSFSGTGKIGGTGGLTKSGTGTVIITNTGINDFIGGVTVNNGTVQFGNGGSSGNLPGVGNVTDNGNLILNRGDSPTVPNVISGAGTLTKSGTGVLTLTGSNDFSGTALVN